MLWGSNMLDNVWFYVALAAIAFIGVTKSGFGSGVGLIIVPVTLWRWAMGRSPGRGEQAALGLLLPLLVAGDLISIWQHRRYFFAKTGETSGAQEAATGGAGAAPSTTAVVEGAKVAAVPAHSTREVMRLLLPGDFCWRCAGERAVVVVPQPAAACRFADAD